MPTISVIIPCFNVAPFIEECIESVISQSFKEIEMICIDDCSTDQTYEILRSYESRGLCQLARHDVHTGPGAARNTGLALAKGDYLFFLDSDDVLAPNIFHTLYQMALETDADVISSQVQHFDELGKKAISYSLKGIQGPYKFANHKSALLGRVYVAAWGRLYKRSFFLEKIGLFSVGVWYEDVMPFLRGQIFASKLAISQEVGVLWRQRIGSISKSKVNTADIGLYLMQAYELFKTTFPLSYREDFLIFAGNTYGWYEKSDELQAFYLATISELGYTDIDIVRSVNIKRLRKMQGRKVSLIDRVRCRVNVFQKSFA